MTHDFAHDAKLVVFAADLHRAALVRCAECCARGDWDGYEVARLDALSHLEAYLDRMAAAFKLAQQLMRG